MAKIFSVGRPSITVLDSVACWRLLETVFDLELRLQNLIIRSFQARGVDRFYDRLRQAEDRAAAFELFVEELKEAVVISFADLLVSKAVTMEEVEGMRTEIIVDDTCGVINYLFDEDAWGVKLTVTKEADRGIFVLPEVLRHRCPGGKEVLPTLSLEAAMFLLRERDAERRRRSGRTAG